MTTNTETDPLLSEAMAKRDYKREILALPEAVERPKAAARIAQLHTAKSMPPHRAAALLASLPSETAEAREVEAQAAEQRQAQAREDMGAPDLKRRVELRLSALSHRADKGDEAARAEARKLSYAMRIVAQSPTTSIATALKLAGANVDAIR